MSIHGKPTRFANFPILCLEKWLAPPINKRFLYENADVLFVDEVDFSIMEVRILQLLLQVMEGLFEFITEVRVLAFPSLIM